MPILSMIVALSTNRAIGKENVMPWYLPADLAYFKAKTLGKPVVMGRKTFESIGHPLTGRRNIVVTRDKNYQSTGIDVVSSVEEALIKAGDVDEIMVIGGGAIYAHCLPVAQRLYITHIDADIDGDTQFPDYQQHGRWEKVKSNKYPKDECNSYDLEFAVYERVISL